MRDETMERIIIPESTQNIGKDWSDRMKYSIDENKRLATVYCTHADQGSEEQQQKLKRFIAECKDRKIFVCVFNSGDGDLLENTKELLAYNYQNAVTRTSRPRFRNDSTR